MLVAPGLQSISSIVVAHELSRFVAWGILLDQGSNPHLLHWQTGSLHWAIREALQLSFKYLFLGIPWQSSD